MSADIASVTISKLLAACAEYRDKLSKLEDENALLKEQEGEREKLLGSAAERETRLLARIGQFQTDKERVDYIEKRMGLSRKALDGFMEASK